MRYFVLTLTLIVGALGGACAPDKSKKDDNSNSTGQNTKPSAQNANPTSQNLNDPIMKLIEQGSGPFRSGNYAAAIGPYQKALDLEKSGTKLDITWFRVLIDNLGMAYGITGKLEEAKKVFEYGISKDKDYPLFYYNMACTYAEMENEDQAIVYLREAFKRKDNMIKGEKFPDPATDSSFKRFMGSKKFTTALAEMKADGK